VLKAFCVLNNILEVVEGRHKYSERRREAKDRKLVAILILDQAGHVDVRNPILVVMSNPNGKTPQGHKLARHRILNQAKTDMHFINTSFLCLYRIKRTKTQKPSEARSLVLERAKPF
jgi:hypothetical protein